MLPRFRRRGIPSLGFLFVANFILSFHLFFVIYENSSFLSLFVAERYVGLIYMVSALLGIGTLITAGGLLRRIGNYQLIISLTFIEILLFLLLATQQHTAFVIVTFMAYLAIFPLMLYSLDIFLESYTKEENTTGSIRGIFLTISNTALIIAPLIAGLVLENSNFSTLYIIAAIFLFPFYFLMRRFRDFEDPHYHNLKLVETFRCIRADLNVYAIFKAQFLLRFFFSFMVIYLPIYLVQNVGFSWAEFGVMTFIYLLPFAVIEYPAGKLADSRLGEKYLLALGFFIMALFTAFMSFVDNHSLIFWIAILFAMRVGASLVEIMTESFFFKHVDGSDNNTISFFRIVRPFAYIIGPAVGTLCLLFLDFKYIWLILGIILLLGLRYSFVLKNNWEN